MDLAGQLPLGALDRNHLAVNRRGNPRRDGHWFLSDSRHISLVLPVTGDRCPVTGYHTTASNSPPRFAARACRSDMRPLGVDTIAIPSPFRTRGISRDLT